MGADTTPAVERSIDTGNNMEKASDQLDTLGTVVSAALHDVLRLSSKMAPPSED